LVSLIDRKSTGIPVLFAFSIWTGLVLEHIQGWDLVRACFETVRNPLCFLEVIIVNF